MRIHKQLEALGTALLLIQKLPANTVWSLTCTNDDDAFSTSVLNIYIIKSDWGVYKTLLRLDTVSDEDTSFVSYRQGALTISFIEEESNGRQGHN